MTPEQRIIRFAREYASETVSCLTAHDTLYRAEALLDDARHLKAAMEKMKDEVRGWYGYEIISYYSVGFVTCLEWHARARTLDLFTYKPECVNVDDLKFPVNSKFFTQMLKDKITVPELIAGSISVGSAEAYMGRFARIFGALGLPKQLWDVLRDVIMKPTPHDANHKYNALDHLFWFRNHRVHEIDSSIVGRYWQRSAKTIDDAIEDGDLTVNIIHAVEGYLSNCAPKHFPGLLDENWLPKAEHDNVEEQIKALEAELGAFFADSDGRLGNWQAATDASARSVELHDEAIASAANLGGTMFIRLRESLHLANRRRRLDFLLFLKRYIREYVGEIVPEQDN